MQKAVGYIRVSTEKQSESGLGLSDQEEKIRRYCEFKGLELIHIYREEGISGSVPLFDRPEGKRIHNREIDFGAVVISKLDRAFRNTADCIATSEAWKKAGISFHIIDLGIDSTTPIGEFFLVLMAAFGQLERQVIRERIKSAIDVKRGRREKLGGVIPFGCDVKKQSGRKVLIRNHEEMEVLDLMVDLRKQANFSFYKIMRLLNKKGIKSKTGKDWKLQSVIDIINRAQDSTISRSVS